MKYVLLSFIMFINTSNSFAQKNMDFVKWAKHNIDSLHKLKIDTLLYYNEFCTECDTKQQDKSCDTFGDVVELENIIIYQQNGLFYTLKFTCNGLPTKARLNSCKSIPFALSIIPILNARDKAYKKMIKCGKFLPPVPTDGTSENAAIYLNKIRQAASFRLSMNDDLYKVWQRYFWFDKEVKLFEFISTDLK